MRPETPIVRVALPEDLEVVVGLALAFRDHLAQSEPVEDRFRAAFAAVLGDPDSEVLLGFAAQGGAAGYTLARFRRAVWKPGLAVEIEDLFVRAASRRCGVGRALLTHLLARAAERGATVAVLTTNERNRAALALYERHGFTAANARWDGARQLWLERVLPPAERNASGAALVAIDHVQLAMPPGGEPAARRFYGELLGLCEVAKPAALAARGGCWFESEAVRVHLGVEPEFRPARKAHPAFRVTRLDPLVARACAAGFTAQREDDRRAYLDDPFGNRIELVEIG